MKKPVFTYRVMLGQHCVYKDGVWFRAFPDERSALAFLRGPEGGGEERDEGQTPRNRHALPYVWER